MTPLFAYIDPSSGVITLQLLLAGLAGGVVIARNWIANMVRKLTGRKTTDEQ